MLVRQPEVAVADHSGELGREDQPQAQTQPLGVLRLMVVALAVLMGAALELERLARLALL
jgi:hypothetical protein